MYQEQNCLKFVCECCASGTTGFVILSRKASNISFRDPDRSCESESYESELQTEFTGAIFWTANYVIEVTRQ